MKKIVFFISLSVCSITMASDCDWYKFKKVARMRRAQDNYTVCKRDGGDLHSTYRDDTGRVDYCTYVNYNRCLTPEEAKRVCYPQQSSDPYAVQTYCNLILP